MRILCLSLLLVFTACSRGRLSPRVFTDEIRLKTTPVKNQGDSQRCWIYAMLAAIESNHAERDDSVNLSAKYVTRRLIETGCLERYISRGKGDISLRGVGGDLLTLISRHGVTHYDAYPDGETDMGALMDRMMSMTRRAAENADGLHTLERDMGKALDETLGPMPRSVFMLGARYTPEEFAHSLCAPGEYVGVTSCSHHPYYDYFLPLLRDSRYRRKFYNLPLEVMMARLDSALRNRRAVCWEGDISERGFSFKDGVADISVGALTPEEMVPLRRRMFETLKTTDDHCMCVVGMARDERGRRYYIMKNSWGADNAYGGYMYVSGDYVRLKTIALFMPR